MDGSKFLGGEDLDKYNYQRLLSLWDDIPPQSSLVVVPLIATALHSEEQ